MSGRFKPMGWQWSNEVEVAGARWPAVQLPSPDPEFTGLTMLRGLPQTHWDELLLGAQQSEDPHAWRVGESCLPEQVNPETMRRARLLLERDIVVYKHEFVTFLGRTATGELKLLGVSAARRQLEPAYESRGFVVLGRALTLPAYRGRGLARHFSFAFFACSQSLCGGEVLGCYIPTETEQTRRMCRRAVEARLLDLTPSGRKSWLLVDRILDVEVFLAFYPGAREWLRGVLAAVQQRGGNSAELRSFLDRLAPVLVEGYDFGGGMDLGRKFDKVEQELRQVVSENAEAAPLLDYLLSARAVGTFTPHDINPPHLRTDVSLPSHTAQ